MEYIKLPGIVLPAKKTLKILLNSAGKCMFLTKLTPGPSRGGTSPCKLILHAKFPASTDKYGWVH